MFPIKIKLTSKFLDELSACECGSYEDMERALETGDDEVSRPLESHTHVVAQRFKTQLVINNQAELDDVYYSVCTGTIQIEERRFLQSAVKVADILRPHVSPHLQRYWPTGY